MTKLGMIVGQVLLVVATVGGCAANATTEDVAAQQAELEFLLESTGIERLPGSHSTDDTAATGGAIISADTYIVGGKMCIGGIRASQAVKNCCEEAGCSMEKDFSEGECADGWVPYAEVCNCGSGTIDDGISPEEAATGSLDDDIAFLACWNAL